MTLNFIVFINFLIEKELGSIDEGLTKGNYQLIGVFTHKGKTVDSGHYN